MVFNSLALLDCEQRRQQKTRLKLCYIMYITMALVYICYDVVQLILLLMATWPIVTVCYIPV